MHNELLYQKDIVYFIFLMIISFKYLKWSK